jgi:hypothetical protein
MFARQEKMLRLTKRQYEEAVGRPAPSLRALQALARRAGGDPVFHQVLVRNPLMLDDPILLELLDREVERLEKLGVTEDTSEPEKPEQS